MHKLPVIKVVGVSAAGKSTLVQLLRARGYDARAISQEHSQVVTLWKQFEVPRVLIYLDTTLEAQRRRRPGGDWTAATLQEERKRLNNACAEADLRINSAAMTSEEVLAMTLAFLRARGIRHDAAPLTEAAATGTAIRPAKTSIRR